MNSGKNGGVGRDWGDLNVQPLNASLAVSETSAKHEVRGGRENKRTSSPDG